MAAADLKRCAWADSTPEYVAYHDDEWGTVLHGDQALFERMSLEAFQSGLSWLIILRKRPAFRAAFRDFDIATVAGFGAADVQRLLADAGIVRHQGKIRSTINNAQRAVELVAEQGSLAAHFWPHASFGPPPEAIESTTPTSIALAKDLKKRGWTFVGPTTVYAFMQAMGLVNDHDAGCFVRDRAEKSRRRALKESRR
jgi:DNA-3-methyladenine glycosylase I